MRRTFEHPDLLTKSNVDDGVTVYDLAHDLCSAKIISSGPEEG